MISRQTQHRRTLNEDELVAALRGTGRYEVTLAKFTHRTAFVAEQMSVVRRSDILIGIHGAGLTHALFLPDWAVLFELYHCGDPGCYGDLARLRGVGYVTWTNDTLLTSPEVQRAEEDPNAKFSSYAFDRDEFVRKVDEAAGLVLAHPEFIRRSDKDEL
jgi:protein O-GlcNAc transferase